MVGWDAHASTLQVLPVLSPLSGLLTPGVLSCDPSGAYRVPQTARDVTLTLIRPRRSSRGTWWDFFWFRWDTTTSSAAPCPTFSGPASCATLFRLQRRCVYIQTCVLVMSERDLRKRSPKQCLGSRRCVFPASTTTVAVVAHSTVFFLVLLLVELASAAVHCRRGTYPSSRLHHY